MSFEKAELVKRDEGWYFCCCTPGCHGCCGVRYGPWNDKEKAQNEGDFYYMTLGCANLTPEQKHRREHIVKWTIFQRNLRGVKNG